LDIGSIIFKLAISLFLKKLSDVRIRVGRSYSQKGLFIESPSMRDRFLDFSVSSVFACRLKKIWKDTIVEMDAIIIIPSRNTTSPVVILIFFDSLNENGI